MDVIKQRYIPTKLPILQTLVVWLLLDRFDASAVVCAVVWTVVVFLWLFVIVALCISNPRDPVFK